MRIDSQDEDKVPDEDALPCRIVSLPSVITEDDPATVGSTEGAQRKFSASLISAAAPSSDLASSQIAAAVAGGNGSKSGAGRRILTEGRT